MQKNAWRCIEAAKFINALTRHVTADSRNIDSLHCDKGALGNTRATMDFL